MAPAAAGGCRSTRARSPDVSATRRPPNPRSYLDGLLRRPDATDAVRRLRDDLASRLGRGVAGLVNAVDPDVVTLGALAGPIRGASPERFADAYDAGLMTLHREQPPLMTTASAGDDAVLAGVGLTALGQSLDAARLAEWAADR